MTVGHGSPHPQNTASAPLRPSLRIVDAGPWLGSFVGLRCMAMTVGLWLLAGLASQTFAEPAGSSTVRCELRMVWGGDTARTYAGSLSVSDGTLRIVRNLSLQHDSMGSLRAEDLKTISILKHSPATFGGLDFAVQGTLATRLQIRIDDPAGGTAREFEVTLAELIERQWLQNLDGWGNRIAIERQLSDRLRIVSPVEPRILNPGQLWPIELSGYRTGLPAGPSNAEIRFISAGQSVGAPTQQQVTIDEDGTFNPTTVSLEAPAQEGAYQLEVSLRGRSYLNAFVTTAAPLVRRLDLVVFDPQTDPQRLAGWQGLATLDPLRASKPGNLAWLASLDMLSALSRTSAGGVVEKLQAFNPLSGAMNQPISHGRLEARSIALGDPQGSSAQVGECLSLQPGAWLALPLQGLSGDVPHRLRVRVPIDRPMELAVSLQQTNALSEFPPLSLDTGMVVDGRQATSLLANQPALLRDVSGQRSVEAAGLTPMTEHELIFWPRGDQAYLVLANMHAEYTASVCNIELERAQRQADPSQVAPANDNPANSNSAGRMVGINLDKPLLADCVSASRQLDSATGRPLESWDTWQQSIVRICHMMRLRQANTLLVKGFSEGGAIFPSEHLAPNHRYDSGTFFSDGRSPELKDAIELMLRHFDREGLRLVLALDINTSLPALARFEAQVQTDSSDAAQALLQQPLGSASTDWIDATTGTASSPSGRSSSVSSASAIPRYNPLNGRVQEEIVATLREIVQRYQGHASFAGIALQIDDQSQLVFAGDRWGYDAQTLNSFAQATQVKLPPPDQLATFFSGTARLAYLDWRANELTKFYARLGEVVQADEGGTSDRAPAAGRKLYLNAIRLWDVYPSSQQFINPDQIMRNPREYLLACGISPERLAQTPQVELMRGSFDAISNSVHAQDWLRRESAERGLVDFFAGTDTSAMVLRYPRRFELAAADKLDKSSTRWIYPTLSRPEAYARKKLIEQIFHSDPLLLVDGGWLPFTGHEAAVAGLMQTLQELPPVKLSTVTPETDSNLRVRQGTYASQSYVQIINNAPWEESLEIDFQTTIRNATARELGDPSAAQVHPLNDAPNHWKLTIAPYSMRALQVDDPHWQLTSLQHAPSEQTRARVAAELEQLEILVSQSADLAQQRLLANIDGDFERWDSAGQPLGWSLSSLPQVKLTRSTDLPHAGQASLLLQNDGTLRATAWALSRPIQPPRTGRLAVQAWFRTPVVSDGTLVKLAVVGRTHAGQRFERSLQLGARSDGATPIAIDWGRKPATLFVGDVSSESVAELSVSIELQGPGKVWVDDVQIFESYLQPDERNHLRGELLVAQQKLLEHNLYPAEKLLDSSRGQYLFHLAAPELERPTQFQLTGTGITNAAASGQAGAGVGQASLRGSSVPGPDAENMTPVSSTKARTWSDSPSVFRQVRDNLRGRWQR